MKEKLAWMFLLLTLPAFAAVPAIKDVWVNPCLVVKGENCTIEWTREGDMNGLVDISFWRGASKEAEIADVPNPPGQNQKIWPVPTGLPAGKYAIRVETNDGQYQAQTENYLDQKGMVVVSGPSGSLPLGTPVSFSWHGFGLGISPTTTHDLYRNGVLVGRIGTADTSHSSGCGRTAGWTVGDLIDPSTEGPLPDKAPAGSGYRIRVTSYSGQYFDETDAFTILLDPNVLKERLKLVTRVPVWPAPGCPACGEVQLAGLWPVLQGAAAGCRVELWYSTVRSLGMLVEAGEAQQRSSRRIDFGDSFQKLKLGRNVFELRLFDDKGVLLQVQPVALNLKSQ